MRLQKYLSMMGVCSRRTAEDLIHQKKVTVDQTPAEIGQTVTPGESVVMVNGKVIPWEPPTKKVLLFYKPVGVECTWKKGEAPCLADFDFGPQRVVSVGRLDQESEGLLLLTTDGELANQLAHPRYEHQKEYLVWLDRPISEAQLEPLRRGVLLAGETRRTKRCEIERLNSPRKIKVTLTEGRQRQIRRLLGQAGFTVMRLKRVRFDRYHLPSQLEPGVWELADSLD